MNDTVTIHDHQWKRSDIAESVEFCLSLSLRLERYHPSPAEASSHWQHEHCEICWWGISECDDPEDGSGFTDGYRWVCCECYRQFLAHKSNETGNA